MSIEDNKRRATEAERPATPAETRRFDPNRTADRVLTQIKHSAEKSVEASSAVAESVNKALQIFTKMQLTPSMHRVHSLMPMRLQPNENLVSNDNKQNPFSLLPLAEKLENVAKETTQNKVVFELEQLTKSSNKAGKAMERVASYLSPEDPEDDYMQLTAERTEKVEKNTSVIGKLLRHSIEFGKYVIDMLSRSKDFTKKILTTTNEWFEYERMRDTRKPIKLTFGERMKVRAKRVLDEFAPEGSKTRLGLNVASGVATFFGTLGGNVGSRLLYVLGKIGVGTGGGFVGMLGRVATFFIGSSKFMGGIAALLASAAIASLFTTPGMMGGYITAFANLWNDGIVPLFKGIATLLAPIAMGLQSWWNSSGESTFLKIGDFVNHTLIYLLGTVIPTVLNTAGVLLEKTSLLVFKLVGEIGTIADLFVTRITDWFQSLAGLFGFGPKAGDFWGNLNTLLLPDMDFITGVASAIGRVFVDVLKWAANMGDMLVTNMIKVWGLSGFFGLEGDDTLLGNIKKMWGDIFAHVVLTAAVIVGKVVAYVTSTASDIVTTIKDKLKSLYESIIDWIPSWDTIKQSLLQAMPERVRGWFEDEVEKDVPAPRESSGPPPRTRNVAPKAEIPDIIAPLTRKRNVAEKVPLVPAPPVVPRPRQGQGPLKTEAAPEYMKFSNQVPMSSPTVVVVPQSTPQSIPQSPMSGGGGRTRGRPTSRPEQSEWDTRLHGLGFGTP